MSPPRLQPLPAPMPGGQAPAACPGLIQWSSSVGQRSTGDERHATLRPGTATSGIFVSLWISSPPVHTRVPAATVRSLQHHEVCLEVSRDYYSDKCPPSWPPRAPCPRPARQISPIRQNLPSRAISGMAFDDVSCRRSLMHTAVPSDPTLFVFQPSHGNA